MKYIHGLCLTVALLSSAFTWAGRPCEEKSPDPDVFRKAMAAGYANMQQLESIKPKVALIARVGQDLSPYRLRYSHLGFVWQDPTENQQWRVLHLLNECGTNKSDLWREGLANFFMDDPFSYDSLLIVPSVAVQERLYELLQNKAQLEQLHGKTYNMVAYPFSTLHQNSNQWALETLARAMSKDIDLKTREQAQQWIKLAGYQGSELKLNTFKRLGGRMFRANISFDDHPTDQRMAGKIQTITVDSIVNFITQTNPGSRYYPVDAKPLLKLN